MAWLGVHLRPADTLSDDQRLASRMRVPCRARTWLEMDECAANA
jgi:hypothetical protein